MWDGGPSYNIIRSKHVDAKNWLDQFMASNGGRYPSAGEFANADKLYRWGLIAPEPRDHLPTVYSNQGADVSLLGNIGRGILGAIPGGGLVSAGLTMAGEMFKRKPPATFTPGAGQAPIPITMAGVGGMGLGGGKLPPLGKLGGLIGKAAGKAGGRLGPGIKRGVKAIPGVAGGAMVWNGVEWVLDQFGDDAPRRRRMNPYNPKALKRADKRVRAFSDGARPILRELGYTVSSHRHVKPKKKRRR